MLAIIDMQEGFETAHCDDTIEHIISEVHRAKEKKEGIVVVEYTLDIYGDTHEPILNAIGGYDNTMYVEKHDDDGSEEVMETLVANGILEIPEPIRVTGVNYQFCVFHTVRGLAERGIERENLVIVEAGCNGQEYGGIDGWQHHRQLYPEFARVELDPAKDYRD